MDLCFSETSNTLVTGGAGLKYALPGCAAVILTSPSTPSKTTRPLEFMVAGP